MHMLRFPSCSFHYIGLMFADTYADRRYNLLNFTLAQSRLTGSAVWWGYSDMPVLDSVTILGVEKPVKSVFVNQASKPFLYHTINKVSFVYKTFYSACNGFFNCYVTDSNFVTSRIVCKVSYSLISSVHVYHSFVFYPSTHVNGNNSEKRKITYIHFIYIFIIIIITTTTTTTTTTNCN